MDTPYTIIPIRGKPGWNFAIDKADEELILMGAKKKSWNLTLNGYLCSVIPGTRKMILLHRLIMGVLDSPKLVVDHLNGDPRDNRRCNLRVTDVSTNNKNRTQIPRNNTSGTKGVYYVETYKKWCVRIRHNGECWVQKYFKTEEEANAFHCVKRREYDELYGVKEENKPPLLEELRKCREEFVPRERSEQTKDNQKERENQRRVNNRRAKIAELQNQEQTPEVQKRLKKLQRNEEKYLSEIQKTQN